MELSESLAIEHNLPEYMDQGKAQMNDPWVNV